MQEGHALIKAQQASSTNTDLPDAQLASDCQIAKLGSKLESFKGQIDEAQTLNAGVQALITLERENYRGLLERKMALEQKTGVVVPENPDLVYYSIHNSK